MTARCAQNTAAQVEQGDRRRAQDGGEEVGTVGHILRRYQ